MELDKAKLDAYITREPDYHDFEAWSEQVWNQFIDEEEITQDEYEGFQDCFTDWETKLIVKGLSPEEAAPILVRAFRRYKYRVPKFEPGDEVRFVPAERSISDYYNAKKDGSLHKGHIGPSQTGIVEGIYTLSLPNPDPQYMGFYITLEGGNIMYRQEDFIISCYKKQL